MNGYVGYKSYLYNQLEVFAKELARNPYQDQEALAARCGFSLEGLTKQELDYAQKIFNENRL